MAKTLTLETKSLERNLHGSKPRSCKVLFPWSSTWTLVRSHHNFVLSLMIGSLQLPPVLMISQTSTLQHGPRCLEIVSTNSSRMKMTPRLTPKTPKPQKRLPPSKNEYQRLWTPPCLPHPCQYLPLHLHLR